MKLENAETLLINNLIFNSKNNLNIKEIKNIDRLAGDASTRRYYRIFDGNKSYVACLDNPFDDVENNEFLAMQKILKENNVSVPEIYDVSAKNGYILEQDLGNTTLLVNLTTSSHVNFELKIYQKVLDDLLKIHQIDIKKYSSSVFTKRSFDYDKFLSEFQFCYKFLFKKFLKSSFTQSEELKLFSFFEKISRILSEGKKVCCHRDFHSRNIMIKDDCHYIIDFQDARLGIPQYDLVSLIEDCYYQITINNRIKLIKYYWALSKNCFLENQSFDQFEYIYNLMAIQRTLKALGSFAYIYFLRNDIRYIKYIGFGFEKLRTFLNKFDDFSDVNQLISKSYYES